LRRRGKRGCLALSPGKEQEKKKGKKGNGGDGHGERGRRIERGEKGKRKKGEGMCHQRGGKEKETEKKKRKVGNVGERELRGMKRKKRNEERNNLTLVSVWVFCDRICAAIRVLNFNLIFDFVIC
jgi:hypothetical protein